MISRGRGWHRLIAPLRSGNGRSRKPLAAGLSLLLACGLLSGCGEFTPPPTSPRATAPAAPNRYMVQPGDTLYSIAWRISVDYRDLAAWNNIPPPYTIYPGQGLILTGRAGIAEREPASHGGKEATPAPPAKVSGAPPKVPSPPPSTAAGRPKAAAPPAAPPPSATEQKASSVEPPVIAWLWPTAGKVLNPYSPGEGLKGIDIRGQDGQAVVAAADGDVVYSGDGLIGYSNLVIIKHDDTYLSAYAHNRILMVKEGARVKRGEKIAEMGKTAKHGSILHFEIRRNGKPVDPLYYLPKLIR